MFKLKLLVLMLAMSLFIGCSGCAGYKSALKEIPEAGFTSFKYHRAGNVTSANIEATGAQIKDGILTIEHISITEDWGPVFNINVELEGYHRSVKR